MRAKTLVTTVFLAFFLIICVLITLLLVTRFMGNSKYDGPDFPVVKNPRLSKCPDIMYIGKTFEEGIYIINEKGEKKTLSNDELNFIVINACKTVTSYPQE